ncbi:hypothetical protein QEN19_001225 [Hanseniaspora menglaensis]
MNHDSFEKSLLFDSFTTRISSFKHSLRTTESKEGVKNSFNDIDITNIKSLLEYNETLIAYIEEDSIDYETTAFKNIILEKVNDVDYLQIQSFLANNERQDATSMKLGESQKKKKQLGIINKNGANTYIFKSQTKKLFLENQHMINSAYNIKEHGKNDSDSNIITLLVNISSLESPNVKMMSKNLLNNLLQQIVFSNDSNLFESDIYKVYAPDDSVKCHKFMNDNQIDLDVGLSGLFFIGNLIKTMLNAASLKKLRIICFYNDFKKFIPTVIEEFLVRLDEVLLAIHRANNVEEIVEFINVFDNETGDVELNEEDLALIVSESTKRQIFLNYRKLELLKKNASTAEATSNTFVGEYMLLNKLFVSFMETFDWNITFSKEILKLISLQLELEVDKGQWINYLEDFFTEVFVQYYEKALNSKDKFIIYSILRIDCENIDFGSENKIAERILANASLQKFMKEMTQNNEINKIDECVFLLQNKTALLEKVAFDFSQRIPKINGFFKTLIGEDYKSNSKINNFNLLNIYANCTQILSGEDVGEIDDFFSAVHGIQKKQLLNNFIDKCLSFEDDVSDVFLNFKIIDDLTTIQLFNPRYRDNMIIENMHFRGEFSEPQPQLFIAYKVFLKLFQNIHKQVKLSELFYCFKELITEEIECDDDQFIMAMFLYTLNQMTHSGLYEISNLHAIKTIFTGL